MAKGSATVQIPFGGGLDNKSDPRLVRPPNASVLKNALFDESGGYQTRNPYSTITTQSDGRKLVAFGDELLLFTKDALYTWSDQAGAFVSRGTYLAPKLTEKTVFTRDNEQTLCDRIEKSDVIVYAWLDTISTTSVVYVAASDKETGAVLVSPTSLGASTTRPRLVALSGQAQVLLFAQTAANTLSVKALDVSSAANLATSIAAAWTTVIAAEFDSMYDVAPLAASSAFVAWRRVTTTSYGYASVALSGSTPTVTASTKVRACTGPIAVAVTSDGTKVAVVRDSNSVNSVRGDILTSAFVDSTVNVAMDTSATVRIAAAFRSVANSGEYRCYAFYSSSENTASSATRFNYINTAGTAGTAAVFRNSFIPVSRAFDHNGSVYVWGTYDLDPSGVAGWAGIKGQFQNTNILYRDDNHLVGKSASVVSGGRPGVTGWLPGVQNTTTNKYVFCGVERRVILLGQSQKGYADRGPRDIEIEFDSDDARRCVQLGKTLYVTGAQIMQYDGEGLTELGFHFWPLAVSPSAGAAGNIEVGTYQYWGSYRSQNAKGELDRGGIIIADTEAVASSAKEIGLAISTLEHTLKTSPRCEIAVEGWRSLKDPSDTSPPLYLVTSKDPASSGNNKYLVNTVTGSGSVSLTDNLADASLDDKEQAPSENESTAPPSATIMVASDDRLICAGIPNNPLEIRYSKRRNEDEVAAFFDGNRLVMPTIGGDITALGFVNGTLVVFKETAIYAMPGEGFDNLGQGQNYGPPQLVSTNLGAASSNLITATDNGLFFFSNKGWYLLDRSFSLHYVGAKVEDYNSDTWNSVALIENKRQIRCASSSRVLVFDYSVEPEGAWSEWEESSIRSSCYWNVTDTATYYGHWYLTSESPSKVKRETVAFTQDNIYSLTWKSAPLSINDLALGAMRVAGIGLLAEYRTAHSLKIELFKNHESTAFQTKLWTVSPTTVGGPEIVVHRPSVQKMAVLQIQVTARVVGSLTSFPANEAFKLSGVTLELGQKSGLHKLPAAQKQ